MSRLNVTSRDKADFLCRPSGEAMAFHPNTPKARNLISETFYVPSGQARDVALKMSAEGWSFADALPTTRMT